MFKPDYRVTKCPICGAELERKQFMGYGITSGYNSSCPNCGKYNDIWLAVCASWIVATGTVILFSQTTELQLMKKRELKSRITAN